MPATTASAPAQDKTSGSRRNSQDQQAPPGMTLGDAGAVDAQGLIRSGNTAPSTSGANGPQGPPAVSASGRKKVYKIRGTTFHVDPQYDVIKAIGLGAYGLVCSAEDTALKRFVAIKKVPKVFDDLVDGKRVLRELKIMRFLGRHPNVVELYDVLRPEEESQSVKDSFRDVYVVTQLMDTDLHLILRSKQRLNFEHHAYFMYQLVRGVAFMHSAGVIHRDLKPGNLLLDGKCDLRICDFGLARGGVPLHPDDRSDKPRRSVAPHELTDYVITRWYRPPELLLMAPYHHGVDMWSVGCIMAEVLLRKALFQGRDYLHQLTLISEIVDIPASVEKVSEALPTTLHEQCKYVARLGAQQVEKERSNGIRDGNTRTRLFARFGLVPEKCSNTWHRVMDLITKLLVFDANCRMSAYQALRHPYLSHLFKPEHDYTHEDKHGLPDPHMFEFDHRELSESDLRSLFWKEMMFSTEHPNAAPVAQPSATFAAKAESHGALGATAPSAAAAATKSGTNSHRTSPARR